MKIVWFQWHLLVVNMKSFTIQLVAVHESMVLCQLAGVILISTAGLDFWQGTRCSQVVLHRVQTSLISTKLVNKWALLFCRAVMKHTSQKIFSQYLYVNVYINTLLGTNIIPRHFWRWFSFLPRWHMLVSWRVFLRFMSQNSSEIKNQSQHGCQAWGHQRWGPDLEHIRGNYCKRLRYWGLLELAPPKWKSPCSWCACLKIQVPISDHKNWEKLIDRNPWNYHTCSTWK